MTHNKAVLLAAVALAALPVQAQTTAPAATATADAGLGDIIVTARKVEERLQDVPLTIKALTGKDLANRGVSSISELTQFTPGLTYSPDFGRTQERPVIRGISALRPEAPQPVSVFVNGVFVRDATLGLVLDDAARVEIIKGPQSALYGRATYAGAINYITVKPGNDFQLKTSATIAGFGENKLMGVVNIPLIKDMLAARVRGSHYQFGGVYTNALSGRKIGNERTNAVGGELSFTPSPAFDALLGIDYSADRDGLFAATIRTIPIQAGGVVVSQNGSTNGANGSVCNGHTINIVGNNPVTGLPDPAFPASGSAIRNGWPCGASTFTGTTVKRNEADLASYTDPKTGIAYGNIAGLDRKVLRGTAVLNFHFGEGYTLTSLSGYTHQTANLGADQSYNGTRFAPGFGAPAASWLSYDRDTLNYGSQELRLSSPQNQPLTWLGGLYYYKEKTHGVSGGVIAQNALFQTVADTLRPKSDASARDIAVFGSVKYTTGGLSLSAEARYGEVNVKVGGTPLGVAVVTVGTCTAGQVCYINGDTTFKQFAPRFTADYRLNDMAMVYGQIAKGTKSGGFNTTPGLPASVFSYDGETVWSYEAGIKSDLFDRRVRFNAAVFLNQISGLQLSNISSVQNPFTGAFTTTTIVNNVGKARTQGFEIEAAARATSWLTLSANYAFTDAKAREGTETTNGTVYGGNRSVEGFTLPRSPRNSVTASAEVAYPIGAEGLVFVARGDLIYQSRRYAEIQNLIWADPFTHFNASIGLQGKGWRAVAFVKNAGDDGTSLNGFRYLDPSTFRRTAVDFLPRLRQWGGTVSFEY